jgi:preprotein translocase subunit YajC
MNKFILPLLQAGAAPGDGAQGGMFSTIIMFVIIIAIFYLLIIRPQSKKRKETEKMLSALKKGDKVVTIGGIYGTIQSVKESTVIIKVDDNVKLEFSRSAVSNIVNSTKEEKSVEQDKSEGSSSETGD